MAKQEINKAYHSFLTEIKAKVHQSQYQAMRQVNSALIGLYWEIGQNIVEKQNRYKWGKSIVEKLAVDLQVPWHAGVVGGKPVEDAEVLSYVSGRCKTRTTRARNRMGA